MLQDQRNRPLRDLRISVTDKCNFRCPYCMPIEVFGTDYEFSPKSDVLTFEEISRLARVFIGLGVEKIRLTGGEPLIRKDLPVLIQEIAEIPGLKDLTLTTNGWFLEERVEELKAAGLKRITVSLDSLDKATYASLNGRGYGPDRVLAGIEAALKAGLTPLKINAVIKRGVNESAVVQLAERFRGTGITIRYIEFMDVGNRNQWKMEDVFSAEEIVQSIHQKYPLEPVERDYPGEVASRYRYLDGQGEIGVIASITQPFCGNCSRGRLGTDGQLVTCLFANGGRNLRDPMRSGASDEALAELIGEIWGGRTDRYSEERFSVREKANRKIEMYKIGG